MSYAPSLNLRLLTFVKIKSKLGIYQLFEFISHLSIYIYIYIYIYTHTHISL